MEYNRQIEQAIGETWAPLMREWIEGKELDGIFSALRADKQNGRVVIPESSEVFKSLQLCPRDKVKCVIILMDPYPTVTKDGVVVANGIPLDCSKTGKMQPSLWSWTDAIEKSEGEMDPDMWQTVSLEYLLEQGVLLINSAWTTIKDCPGIHAERWTPFMKELIRILNTYHRGLPICLLGAQAQRYEKEINPLLHYIHKCEHPVMGSRENRAWRDGDMFNWINRILEKNNGAGYKIDWKRKKPQIDDSTLPPWVTETVTAHSGIPSKEEQEKILDKVEGQWDDTKLPWENGVKQQGIKKK